MEAPTPLTEQDKKKHIRVVFCTLLLDMISFGMMIPVIPLLFTTPLSPYFILGGSVFEPYGLMLMGALLSIYPLAIFFCAPVLGELSDSYGRKKILLVCLLGTTIAHALFAYGIAISALLLLFVSRALDGITGANISVVQASISDISTRETRGKYFGMVGAAFGLGFIIGPFIGGVLSDAKVYSSFSPSTPFICAALLSIVNMISVHLFFKETNTTIHRGKVHLHPKRSLEHIASGFAMKGLRRIFSVLFLQTIGFTFFTTVLGVYLVTRFSFTQVNIGNFFALVGISGVIVQAAIVPLLTARYTETQLLRVSLLGLAIGMWGYAYAHSLAMLYMVIPFFSLWSGITMSQLSASVSKHAGVKEIGKVFGIQSSIQSLAQAITPLFAGLIASTFSPRMGLVAGGVSVCIAWLLFIQRDDVIA